MQSVGKFVPGIGYRYYPCSWIWSKVPYRGCYSPLNVFVTTHIERAFLYQGDSVFQAQNWAAFVTPLSSHYVYLSLNSYGTILGCFDLLLGGAKLRFDRQSRILRVNPSLLYILLQHIGLRCKFFELVKEHEPSKHSNNESHNGETESPAGVPDGEAFKDAKFVILDDSCSDRFIHQNYRQWIWILGSIILSWIIGRCGADVLLHDGRWGKWCSSILWRFSRRSFTDRERVLVGVRAGVVAAFLPVHVLINVTQKLLTTPEYCNTLILIGNKNWD